MRDATHEQEPALLRPDQAARMLAISRSKVYSLLAQGDLPVLRVGASVRIPRMALEAWIQANTETPAA